MNHRGFTFLELLLTVAILSGLAVTVAVGLNPVQRFKETRDARRTADVESILSAIHASVVDNRGSLPSGLSTGMAERQLGTAGNGCSTSGGGCNVTNGACLDLSSPLAKYIKSLPLDPNLSNTATNTGYAVSVDSNGIITIKACFKEGSENISLSR